MVSLLRCGAMSALATAVLSLSACGPKVRSSLPREFTALQTLAVLPVSVPSGDLPRERVDLVKEAVISELRNSNFIVLDEKIVTEVCSSPACPEKRVLSERYLADGFVSLELRSFAKSNFLAGYYNSLDGRLVLLDRDGAVLVEIDHTESERGGLLFESGQLFQGIISQAKRTGEGAYEQLANKFAREAIAKLPSAKRAGSKDSGINSEGMELALKSVNLRWPTQSVAEVCATGTPNSFGYLIYGGGRSVLRETTPGVYCGAFGADTLALIPGSASVELRTAYGNSIRNDLPLGLTKPCNLSGKAVAAAQGKGSKIEISCDKIDGKFGSNCGGGQTNCYTERVLVFRRAPNSEPFLKVGETKQSLWVDSKAPEPVDRTEYQVVAVGPRGVTSTPARVGAVSSPTEGG